MDLQLENLKERATRPALPAAAAISDAADKLPKLLKDHKLSPAEFERVKGIAGRLPTMTELGVFSAMWSEHCSYKSSKVHLKKLPTKAPWVVVGPGENAGVVRLKGSLCAAFKMESHNHPSYIEPYQGAATGVGGILRDVFCMGARPIANLNCLRFGRKEHPKTAYLIEHAVKGIGDYGNCVGIPTVGGNISIDASYDGNCLVNAMTVGLIDEAKIFKGFASGPGNFVVYVGSATGRDGVHGATMASDSFDSSTSGERSTVQVGDPFTEKLLLEATLAVLDAGLVVGLQDMGAAGLTSSSFEMADRAETGVFIDLDRVPVRTQNLSAYELMLSESQERMLMVVEPAKLETLLRVLGKWELACAVIGVVTASGRMQVSYQGRLEVDLPVGPLAEKAPMYERPYTFKPYSEAVLKADGPEAAELRSWLRSQGTEEVLRQVLAANGSKRWIYEQYDRHIGSRSLLHSNHGGAAVLALNETLPPGASGSDAERMGLAISSACPVEYNAAHARFGASLAIVKAARMLAAAGARPLAATDCLNFGNPEKPEVMGDFVLAIEGMSQACQALDVPIVSGNVSLYNETDGSSIVPTPMIGMVGLVEAISQAKAASFGGEDAQVYLVRAKGSEPGFAASRVAKLAGKKLAGLPYALDLQAEKSAMSALPRLFQKHDAVLACRDLGEGGLLTTLVKMILDAAPASEDLPLLRLSQERLGLSEETFFFAEWGAAYLLAVKSDSCKVFEQSIAAEDTLQWTKVAEVLTSGASGSSSTLSLKSLRESWQLAFVP